jgi:cell wall-associated NlpC family hydrolase
MTWTLEQIQSFAPDTASFAAGQKLGKPGAWLMTGESENALWGECQGSGKNPYQIRIDKREFAYRCTCPSRKLPCKHVLGLLLLAANNPNAVPQKAEPDWIAEWLGGRDDRAQKKQEKAAAPPKPVDEKAQAKRAEQRQNRVTTGLEQFALWLNDIARTGIAGLERKPVSFWDDQAKRLVDAQAPALATRLQSIAEIPGSNADWPEQLLGELGRLALLVEAYQHGDTLPDDLQSEIRQLIGWTIDQNELATSGETVTDCWGLLGQSYQQDGKIQTQRNWYYGVTSGRPLLLLQFAAGNQGFTEAHLPGSFGDGDAVYWPGTGKLRGKLLKREINQNAETMFPKLPAHTIVMFLESVADQLAVQPWQEIVPALLRDVIVCRNDASWGICDSERRFLPLAGSDHWKLHAISGGHPVTLFGEWNGRTLAPLSIWANNKFYHLL